MIDPIVEEIRQIRARIFQECNEDMNVYVERLRAAEAQEQDRERIVSLEALRARQKRGATTQREVK